MTNPASQRRAVEQLTRIAHDTHNKPIIVKKPEDDMTIQVSARAIYEALCDFYQVETESFALTLAEQAQYLFDYLWDTV